MDLDFDLKAEDLDLQDKDLDLVLNMSNSKNYKNMKVLSESDLFCMFYWVMSGKDGSRPNANVQQNLLAYWLTHSTTTYMYSLLLANFFPRYDLYRPIKPRVSLDR